MSTPKVTILDDHMGRTGGVVSQPESQVTYLTMNQGYLFSLTAVLYGRAYVHACMYVAYRAGHPGHIL